MSTTFEPGVTYIQNQAYRAPELLWMFKCDAVGTHPVTGAAAAYGWMTTVYPGDAWQPAALYPDDWDDEGGWVASGE